jgi:hypothetical protein
VDQGSGFAISLIGAADEYTQSREMEVVRKGGCLDEVQLDTLVMIVRDRCTSFHVLLRASTMVRLFVMKIKGWRIAQPRRRFGGSRLDGRLLEITRRAKRLEVVQAKSDWDRIKDSGGMGGARQKERDAVCSGVLWICVLVSACLHG